MARQVISKDDLLKIKAQSDSADEPKEDNYSDRLLKYIPAEIIAVFITVQGVIEKFGNQSDKYEIASWIVFIVFAIFTPVYLVRMMNVKKIIQLIISFFAFIIWVFALGGPFTTLDWYDPIYGEIILPIYTLLIAMVVAKK